MVGHQSLQILLVSPNVSVDCVTNRSISPLISARFARLSSMAQARVLLALGAAQGNSYDYYK